MPYTRNANELLVCSGDSGRVPHASKNGLAGKPLVPRSYIANRAAENLNQAQIKNPTEIIIVSEKVLLSTIRGSSHQKIYTTKPATRSRDKLTQDPCGLPYSGVDLTRRYPLPLPNSARTPWFSDCPS